MSKWMRDIRHGGKKAPAKLDTVIDEVVDEVDEIVVDEDLDLEDGE
jgi:hypothetical protein